MAKVTFKRGSAANLPSSNIADGCFYLTTDTNRLYVGQGTELVELNKSITAVSSLADLPTFEGDATKAKAIGQFYYVINSNILCYYDNTTAASGNKPVGWKQINPDTNTKLDSTNSTGLTASGTTSPQLNLNIKDTDGTAISSNISITGDGNVTVTESNGNIVISGTGSTTDTNTTYAISSADTTGGSKIVLTPSSGTADEIELVSADNNLTISQTNDKITFTAADQSVDLVTTSISNNILTVAVKDKTGESKSDTVTLPETYTKSEVDNLFVAADAMTFKGVLDSSTVTETDFKHKNVPTANVNAGDTYKIAKMDTYASLACKVGDLLIAVEDKATSTDANWVLVHSGDDQVIQFTADSTTGIASTTDGASVSGYKVAGDDKIDVTYAESNGIVTATVKQNDDYTTYTLAGSDDVTQSAKNTATFEAITDITIDKYGNVTNAEKHTFTVTDTHNSIDAVTNVITHDSNGATITVGVKDTDAETAKTGSFTVKSDNLTITNGTSNGSTASTSLAINLEWGSF